MKHSKMNISNRIKYHHDHRQYCKILRQVGKDAVEKSNGYIVDYSDNFVLLQEAIDFDVDGFVAFPIQTISEILYNNNDKYYDKIMHLEGIVERIEKKHQINLTSWATILKSIKKLSLNVIIENEDPEDKTFDIGQIIKITKTAVYIRYFNARGIFDEDVTKISWNLISLVTFDDRYTNLYSKHLRERNLKQKSNSDLK